MRLLAAAALAILTLAACTPSGAVTPSPVASAGAEVSLPPSSTASTPSIRPTAPTPTAPSATFAVSTFSGHGIHLQTVAIPAGSYSVSWSARGALPDGAPGGCRFDVAAGGPELASLAIIGRNIGRLATRKGTVDIDLPAAADRLVIHGTECTWELTITPI